MVRFFDVVSNSTQRLMLYEIRKTDKPYWISAKTNTVMMFLDFLLSPVPNKEKLSKLKESSYELASLMNRQIFDTVGVLTHNWKATAFFIDNQVGYFDAMTRKIAGCDIVGKKELKLRQATTDYFTGKTIDLTGLWQISRYTSNYIYSAEAMLFTDLINRKFAYGLLDTRSEEARDEIKRLEKDNAEIKIRDIRVMYSSKATTWRGYGEFQICLWLGSYEIICTQNDKAVAVYNVFLLIGGARQLIDHVVTYIEGLLNERLPQEVTDDLFRANSTLNVK